MVHRYAAAAAALALLAASAGQAAAQQVTAAQISVVSLDPTYRGSDGKTTKLSASYENKYWRFMPMSNDPRTVDLDGSFLLAGPNPGLISLGCDERQGQGRIVYSSDGPRSDSYACRHEDSTKSFSVTSRMTKAGDTLTLKGRMQAVERSGSNDTVETWDLSEELVLKVAGGNCRVVRASLTRTVAKDSGYDRAVGTKPTLSRTVSKPKSACAFM